MAYVDVGPPNKEYSARLLFQIFQILQNGINYMDENNFPNGISGSILKAASVPGAALIDYSVSLKKLIWGEYHVPLILAASEVSTTSTTGTNYGGYFVWNPNAFPTKKWYLEASIASADSSATATCILKGSMEYASVSTTSTSLTLVRSPDPITMPPAAENLWIVLKTSNSSYAAKLMSARLIFIPE